MKKHFLSGILLALLIISFGCAPRLAESPYGELEQNWQGYIKQSYPSWKPPQTIPPTTLPEDKKALEAEEETAGEVLEIEAETPVAVELPEDISKPAPPIKQQIAEPLQEEALDIPEAAQDKGVKEVEYYTIQKGDSLWRIAVKFYNDGNKWKKIYEANIDIIPSPHRIPAGLKLKIPPPESASASK